MTLTAASLWELSALSFHYVHDYFSQYSLEQPLIQISRRTEWMFVCVNKAGLLRLPHTGPTAGRLKRLERLGRGREQICLVCSGVSEAFGAARTLLDQHAKSEEVGRRTSEPLDSLIGGVLANQRSVWEGRNTVCTLVFYALHSVISCFHALEYWHETSCY